MKDLLAAFLSAFLCTVCCGGPFTVRVSTKSKYEIGNDVTCWVKITNNHDKDYFLLMRNTPLEGLKSSLFLVTNDGKPLPYEGLLFKRQLPSISEHIRIRAKSSLVSSVDLASVYGFKSPGACTVRFETMFQYYEDSLANSYIQFVSSDREQFFITEGESLPKLTIAESLRRNTTQILPPSLKSAGVISPMFSGNWMSIERLLTVVAYLEAYSVLGTCYYSVASNPALYTQYFGARYINYMNRVKRAYMVIKSSMESHQYTLNYYGSYCAPNVYAYTFSGSLVIYLCDAYLTAPSVGIDSKMGIIVHEMSHAAAGTKDIVYGMANCRVLAHAAPMLSIRNADTYEYFAESQI